MKPGKEFKAYVNPQYFRKMHYKVKKLTGIDSGSLRSGSSFSEAFEAFREFCGDNVTFITWGCDDKRIFEQNVIIHDLDWDWIDSWINLQLIYNVQTGRDKNQKSLESAMEHFGIEQTRVAHDALGDAYNTALICSKLDMAEGIDNYDKADEILSARMPVLNPVTEHPEGNQPLKHEAFAGFESKASAFADDRIAKMSCPKCGGEMKSQRWVNQGDGRYMNVFTCQECGKFLMRVKFRKEADARLIANYLLYEADDDMLKFYKDKMNQAKRRGRSPRKRKK